jgi:hypothetical protein
MGDMKRWSAALFLTLAACATTASAPSIYYKSQAEADAAFAAFDKDNPDCQLWTNWQKMCSRTGENGATFCQKARVSVKPSVPFCTTTGEFDDVSDISFSTPQMDSYLRFCSRKTGEIFNNVPACIWSKNRPFSGLNIKEQKHPWCKTWKLTVSKSVNPSLSKENGYKCADRSVPAWCDRVLGMEPLFRVNERPVPEERLESLSMGSPIKPSRVPVNSPYCDKRNSNAEK